MRRSRRSDRASRRRPSRRRGSEAPSSGSPVARERARRRTRQNRRAGHAHRPLRDRSNASARAAWASSISPGRTRPSSAHVALKLLKRGLDTARIVARFEAERRTLALMDHPHIARVLDAGASEDGRPCFVMELVRGERLTVWCDRERLDVRSAAAPVPRRLSRRAACPPEGRDAPRPQALEHPGHRRWTDAPCRR